MRGMLLAAGRGTRLGGLGRRLPKPMIRLEGRPVLEHGVRWFTRSGVRDIMINLHHHPSAITGHFGDGRRLGARLSYSHEPRLLGTAGAVRNVLPFFSSTFVLGYGDNLARLPLGPVIAFHRARRSDGTLVLFPGQETSPRGSGVVCYDRARRITRIKEKPAPGARFRKPYGINAGIYILEPRLLRLIPEGRPMDFMKHLFPAALKARRRLFAFPTTARVRGIDTPERFKAVRRELTRRPLQSSGHPEERR